MTRTRSEIKTIVHSRTGRTKDTLESSLCDDALKLAIQKHPFWDAISSTHSDFELTEDDESEDISSSSAVHVVTARIIETSGTRNTVLVMKNRVWWDANVINANDNPQGWPQYGLFAGGSVYFDRPVQSGLTLRVRVAKILSFTDDTTVCPIACLDLFVEKYVTAQVFLSILDKESYMFWKSEALGPAYDRGAVGGALLNAINFDKFGIGEDLRVERSSGSRVRGGVSIENLITGHGRYGEVDTWY